MKKVSVVILNWNGVGFLKKFLPGVINYSQHPDYEVVVADNASSDDSVKFVKTNFPSVKLIELTQNYGFAGGYNKALAGLNSEYFILLNSDVDVTENWITPQVEFMDANPEVGACMPKLRCYDAPDYFEYAGAAGGYIDKYGYPFCRGRIFNTIEKDEGQYDNVVQVFWASGAALLVRAEAYWKVGGLDTHFFAHMEEIDLCWRLQWQGFKIMALPYSTVYHVGGGALPKENPRKTFLNFRNNLFLLYKNLPDNKLLKTLFIRMCLDFLAAAQFLLSLKFKHFWAVFRAHIEFYQYLKYLKNFRKTATYLTSNKFPFDTIWNSSIVKSYFVNKTTTYKQLPIK